MVNAGGSLQPTLRRDHRHIAARLLAVSTRATAQLIALKGTSPALTYSWTQLQYHVVSSFKIPSGVENIAATTLRFEFEKLVLRPPAIALTMASATSASPPAQIHRRTESNEDADSWQCIDSNPESIFFPSPASGVGSMNSWVIGSYSNNVERSPQGMSPLQLETDFQNVFSTSFPEQANTSTMLTSRTSSQYTEGLKDHGSVPGQDFLFAEPFDSTSFFALARVLY